VKISPGTVVKIEYAILTDAGEIVESSDLSGPLTFIHGRSGLLPGLDRALFGMGAGDEKQFTFGPRDAFGTIEDAPEKIIARSEFPADANLEPGTEFEAGVPGGSTIRLRVEESGKDAVRVKMIHPLADQPVTVSVKVLHVRPATSVEQASGRVGSPPPPPGKGSD
jgi:FKBP-type peptidyl-prolyl cis-trans isomerase SlyD